MKVELRPIINEKWHGKKGKESFARPQKLGVLVGEDMKYATGLTVKEAEEYGKQLGQNLNDVYIQGQPHPFWDSPMGVIKLENNTQFLETDRALDAVKVKNMKASKYVANSMKEYNEGFYPEATHVIFDESEEIEVKASRVALEQKAILEQSKLSQARKEQILLILTGKDLKGQSSDYITVEMNEEIKRDPAEVLRYIQQDKAQVLTHALVIEALQKGILRKVGHKVTYMDNTIGGDELDAAIYLLQDDNQELKIRLMKAVND